ncbi:hypothetical protein FXO21_28245 [Dyadobacter sp. UC 10]|nr:hypothetical protein FXO21_28245 [Dyadobacter sp. UC 10]
MLIAAALISCQQSADDPQEAAEILTASPKWKIDEIRVNDVVTFQDGKMTQQFGGIDFQRYMEIVEIRTDGTFSGVFKGESKPFLLEWKRNEKNIRVGLPGAKSAPSDWTITPADVQEKAFSMKTQSTAYDYPNVTRIALKFKAAK